MNIKKATAINEAINTSIFNVRGDISEGQEIIGQFKEKFETANEKYMILTCLPKSWSENRIRSEFNVSPYVAHTAKVTQANKGIMPFPDKKYQHNISDDIVKIVKDFYDDDDDDDVSRMMAE